MSLGPSQLNPDETDNFEDARSFRDLHPFAFCSHLYQIEKQFAVKAVEHMSTYWAILEKMRGSQLRLTKIDDDIYQHLKTDFPAFDPRQTINEDEMKSKGGKERWRKFMMAYEKSVVDYNFGTILRLNPAWEYGQKETIFVPRMQFYAVEIARNREGYNDWIYEKAHPNEKTQAADS